MAIALPSERLESDLLKVVMAKRGLKASTLGAMASVHPRVVTNIICCNDLNWPPRERINSALGMKIFTNPPAGRRRRRSRTNTTPKTQGTP